MASGDKRHPIRAEEGRDLVRIQRQQKFKDAYAKYVRESDKFHIPYLAGSNNEGTTVFYDSRTPDSDKKSIGEHEKVEGILIRLYGFDYDKAHRYASIAERRLVKDWPAYERRLRGPISDAEHAPAKNLPPNLLAEPYRGTKFMPVVSKAQNAAMHSAAEGKSTLGIPKKVGAEFIADQAPGSVKKLPTRVNSKVKHAAHRGMLSKRASGRHFKTEHDTDGDRGGNPVN